MFYFFFFPKKPKAIKAGPSSQKIPASGTDLAGAIALAATGMQMIPKSTHVHVIIFAAFFFKF